MSETTRGVWGVLLFVLALAAQAQERTLSVSSRESSDQRLALVIGNSAYKVGPLRNPANDARAMANALRASGFEEWKLGDIAIREFSPFAVAFGVLKPGGQFTDVKGVPAGGNNLADWAVSGKVAGEEEVTVPAGRFRATKVVLVGSRNLQPMTPGAGRFELTVWYAPELKRHVKLKFDSFVRPRGSWNYTDASSRDLYELVGAPAR